MTTLLKITGVKSVTNYSKWNNWVIGFSINLVYWGGRYRFAYLFCVKTLKLINLSEVYKRNTINKT